MFDVFHLETLKTAIRGALKGLFAGLTGYGILSLVKTEIETDLTDALPDIALELLPIAIAIGAAHEFSLHRNKAETSVDASTVQKLGTISDYDRGLDVATPIR